MTIATVTTWEGTPQGIAKLIEGSKQSASIHAEMGAKNPRLWRVSSGGEVHQAFYEIQFDSHEDYGKFTDAMIASGWFDGMMKWMGDNQDDIKNLGTMVMFDAL